MNTSASGSITRDGPPKLPRLAEFREFGDRIDGGTTALSTPGDIAIIRLTTTASHDVDVMKVGTVVA